MITKPEEVEDIVFNVGLNDLRRGSTPEEIQTKYLDMQMAYNKTFPNARQHITALPPLHDAHKEVNKQLQKLSSFVECNFVSTKPFIDQQTNRLRAKLMKGFHYTPYGVCILATEIKRSLKSTANIGDGHLKELRLVSETNYSVE